MSVCFISKVPDFKLLKEDLYNNWIEKVVGSEGKSLGEIQYIFVDSKSILYINNRFLNHDFVTDIITFNTSFLNTISGEIYICLPIVKENATLHSNNLFIKELQRIIIHGILHLVGYNDSNDNEIIEMRELEDFYLKWCDF